MIVPNGKPFDLIIVGAGPAGATAAIYARRYGLNTLLLDKARFPRDKICGDALGGKAVQILRDLNLLEPARHLPGASIKNILFGSPKHIEARIDLTRSSRHEFVAGFVIRRQLFDHFMFEQARSAADACLEGFKVEDVLIEDGRVCGVRGRQEGQTEPCEFRGHIVLGADGYKSVVARKMGLYDAERSHSIVALRQYHAHVKGFADDQIELHYVEDVIPGYFWMFPLESGYANVGIGLLSTSIKRRKLNLRKALEAAIHSPHFRDRFTHATPCEPSIGWNLLVGSKHRKNYGAGFMLLGDAAGVIDPFTGEGIGNAMYSSRYAVETAREACDAGDFSAAFLRRYDQRLWDDIGDELRVSTRLQTIGQSKLMLNFTIGKAARSPKVRDLICGMIADEVPKKHLVSPLFYFNLLFS
jgi:geranylgeranyl reductase family protein